MFKILMFSLLLFNVETDQIEVSKKLDTFLTVLTKTDRVNVADVLKCKINNIDDDIDISLSKNEVINKEIDTPGQNKYLYYPYNMNCLSFKVQAEESVHVGIVREKDNFLNTGFEINLGGFGNKFSQIRRNCTYTLTYPCGNVVNQAETDNLLSKTELRGFWMSWSDNDIKVGKYGSIEPFLFYHEPNEVLVNYIGIHTYEGFPGKWVFEEPNCPGYKKKNATHAVGDCIVNLKFSNVNKLSNLAENLLKNIQTDFENFKSRNQKTKILLVRSKQDLENFYKKINNLRDEIYLNAVNGYDVESILTIFNKIKDTFSLYYETLNRESNKSNETNVILPNKLSEITTLDSVDYQYFKKKENCFTFKVFALNDVNLVLTSKPEINANAVEIILGGWFNSKSAILKNSQIVTELDTNGILSKNEYRGFWIQWYDKVVKVGRAGETAAFMFHEHIDFPNFQYIGIRTTKGATGIWIIEDPLCPPSPSQTF